MNILSLINFIFNSNLYLWERSRCTLPSINWGSIYSNHFLVYDLWVLIIYIWIAFVIASSMNLASRLVSVFEVLVWRLPTMIMIAIMHQLSRLHIVTSLRRPWPVNNFAAPFASYVAIWRDHALKETLILLDEIVDGLIVHVLVGLVRLGHYLWQVRWFNLLGLRDGELVIVYWLLLECWYRLFILWL
jgi:hypothetical protein